MTVSPPQVVAPASSLLSRGEASPMATHTSGGRARLIAALGTRSCGTRTTESAHTAVNDSKWRSMTVKLTALSCCQILDKWRVRELALVCQNWG